jgi:DNA repair protein RadC
MIMLDIQPHGPAGHRQRLRTRFEKSGRSALADYELLELLLTYSIPRVDTKPTAKALLHRFGNIVGVLQQPHERLMEIRGIGPNTATFLRVVQAFLVRCTESVVEQSSSITGPEDIFAFVRLHLGQRETECVYALYLNDARQVVHHAQAATGTVDRVPIYPREVLKPALIHDATGIILIHNHPQGQAVPSEHDLEITRQLEKTATPFGIKLIDHLIVTQLQAYSIKTGKLL